MASSSAVRLEAPDGGWGVLVCIGMAMSFISGFAAIPSFGLLFGDFLRSIGAETTAVAFITSAFFCAFSFAGLFSGSLFNRYGVRTMGLVGGTLYFAGSLVQVFVSSTLELLLAFSVIQGTGFGLMVPASYSTFNNYFVKKRVLWMSFSQTLMGCGTMLFPVIVQKLLERYGFRGCLAVLAAINSHAVLGMLLMQPVEWHLRKVEVELDVNEQELTEMNVKTTEGERNGEDPNHLSPLVHNKNASRKLSKGDLKILSSRSSSIVSLGNWSGPVVVSDASPEMSHVISSRRASPVVSAGAVPVLHSRSTWQVVVDFLDLTLMKNPVYVNIVLGMSFALYSDLTFFTFQPLYLFELGFDKPDTASIIAIGAAADLASRIFLAFSAIFIQVPSRHIYLAGAFFTVIARFAFLTVFDYRGMSCITAVLGFLRTWIHVPLPLVLAEYLPKERFATGYGLFMFLQGNIMFAIGPLVGHLHDKTHDFVLIFHCLNFFMALCAFPWLIEIVCTTIRRRTRKGRVPKVHTKNSDVHQSQTSK